MTYVVHVIGPYDSTFIGPFDDLDAANEYLRSIDRNIFNAYVLTTDQFWQNQLGYGPVELVPSKEWRQ